MTIQGCLLAVQICMSGFNVFVYSNVPALFKLDKLKNPRTQPSRNGLTSRPAAKIGLMTSLLLIPTSLPS